MTEDCPETSRAPGRLRRAGRRYGWPLLLLCLGGWLVRAGVDTPLPVSVACRGDAAGKEGRRVTYPGQTGAVALSPDGRLLACQLTLWPPSHRLPVRPAWSWGRGGITLLNVETGRLAGWMPGAGQGGPTGMDTGDLAFSPDGAYVAASQWCEGSGSEFSANTLTVWRTSDGESLPLPYPSDAQGSLCWSPDGRLLAAESVSEEDNGKRAAYTRVWEIPSGRRLAALPRGSGMYVNLFFSPAGDLLAVTGGKDTDGGLTVTLYDTRTWRHRRVLSGFHHRGYPLWISFSRDGRLLAATSYEKRSGGWLVGAEAAVWQTTTGRCLRSLRDSVGRFGRPLFSPDGARLLSGECLLDLQDPHSRPQPIAGLSGHSYLGPYSGAGALFADAGRPGTVELWDTRTWQRRRTWHVAGTLACLPSANGVLVLQTDARTLTVRRLQ